MIEACREGPPGARVSDLAVSEAPEPAGARGVQILPTA